jgi:hypothetical protein
LRALPARRAAISGEARASGAPPFLSQCSTATGEGGRRWEDGAAAMARGRAASLSAAPVAAMDGPRRRWPCSRPVASPRVPRRLAELQRPWRAGGTSTSMAARRPSSSLSPTSAGEGGGLRANTAGPSLSLLPQARSRVCRLPPYRRHRWGSRPRTQRLCFA